MTASTDTPTTIQDTYYRWTQLAGNHGSLLADILGADVGIVADPTTGRVTAVIPDRPMDPDTARMVGVRLIEAAALADNGRSVRAR